MITAPGAISSRSGTVCWAEYLMCDEHCAKAPIPIRNLDRTPDFRYSRVGVSPAVNCGKGAIGMIPQQEERNLSLLLRRRLMSRNAFRDVSILQIGAGIA